MRRAALTKIELLIVVGLIFVLMACTGIVLPAQFIFFVLFGWAVHVYRLSGQVRVDWPELIWACVALSIFVIGLHWFCSWFASAQRNSSLSSDNQQSSPVGFVQTVLPAATWRPRWTVAMTSVIVLMFVAGISMVGVTHHLAWMLRSNDEIITDNQHVYRRSSSQHNLKYLGYGLHTYHDERGSLPAGATIDEQGRLLHGWMTAILPFVEQQPLADKIDHQRDWDDPVNAEAFRTQVKSYQLPYPDLPARDAKENALTGYSSNVHLIGGTGPGMKLDQITDGTSNTILAGEAFGNYKPWGHPRNWRDPALGINQSPDGFGGPRKSGSVFVLADGSVRHLPAGIDPVVLTALATPSGGEPLPKDLP